MLKRLNDLDVLAQQHFDGFRWLVAATKPDHFWRRTYESSPFREVRIKGNDCEATGARVVPNRLIVGFFQPGKSYLDLAREKAF